jgi:PAS fold
MVNRFRPGGENASSSADCLISVLEGFQSHVGKSYTLLGTGANSAKNGSSIALGDHVLPSAGRATIVQEECTELTDLINAYSIAAAEFSRFANLLQKGSKAPGEITWTSASIARESADAAWRAIEDHVREHRCMEWTSSADEKKEELVDPEGLNAPDFMLVADNTRRFIGATERAQTSLGLDREAILGRCIEDLFSEAGGLPVETAWADFVRTGAQQGICTTVAALGSRRFHYRAQANFAPGFHICVLREAIEE